MNDKLTHKELMEYISFKNARCLRAFMMKIDYQNRQFIRQLDGQERIASEKLDTLLNTTELCYQNGYWNEYLRSN